MQRMQGGPLVQENEGAENEDGSQDKRASPARLRTTASFVLDNTVAQAKVDHSSTRLVLDGPLIRQRLLSIIYSWA
jgi:hypothetical protein